ncbi:MAG: cupin domain-containing protein [Acidimicrobiales bacterium]
MDAVFSNVDQLFTELVPDPESFEGGPEMLVGPLIEGAIDSGVWTCGVGSWDEKDYEVNEVMVMVDGRLRITDGGSPDAPVHDLRAGDMFFLPKGWAGRWEVVEPMKKIYFIVE